MDPFPYGRRPEDEFSLEVGEMKRYIRTLEKKIELFEENLEKKVENIFMRMRGEMKYEGGMVWKEENQLKIF